MTLFFNKVFLLRTAAAFPVGKLSTIFPRGMILVYYKSMENFNYSFTSREDECLTDIIAYFVDQGLPENFDNDAFDSLSDKILLGRASAK